MQTRSRAIADVGLALLSGLMLTAAFPKIGLSWLAWVALVPLLACTGRVPAGRSFRLGFLAGLAHYLTLCYWLVATMQTYGGLPVYLSVPLLVLLSAYLSLFIGAFAWSVHRLCPTPPALFGLVPFIWTALEYLRSFLLSGFPWELLGYAHHRALHLIQISDILGVYGVSFLTALVNGAAAVGLFFLAGRPWKGSRPSRAACLTAAAAAVLALLAAWGYGAARLRAVEALAAKAPKVRVAVAQGNIPQQLKWDPAFKLETTAAYLALSQSAAALGAELVVWPETAAPFYFGRDRADTSRVLAGARQAGVFLLVGSPTVVFDGTSPGYYNSAYLVDPGGDVRARYDKAHLVPFGEYVPLKHYLPFVGKIVAQVGDFRPGQKGRTLAWGPGDLGILICYEIIFPELARAMAASGAGMLINITNDAWYGRSSAPYQHFSMAVFRAVENRRALVRSANTGISGFIDPSGRVLERTPLFERHVRVQDLPVLSAPSVYTRCGDLFARACLIVAAGAGLRRLRRAYAKRR